MVRSGWNLNLSDILCMSSLPASINRIGSKTTVKRWRHHFPYFKSMGVFCCHGNQSFDPICPKTLCSLSPTPVMLHIKFDQYWPTGLRDIQVQKCEISVTQAQVTPTWVAKNRTWLSFYACPGYQQLWWWFDQKWTTSMETPFSHYKSMGNFLDAQRQLTL